jgi:FtsZ-binding cell division protein ZapB
MSASETALAQLEACLTQVVQLLSSLQTENGELVEKIEKLKTDLEEAKKGNNSKDQRIEQLKDDRLKIRAGVEKIMRKMTALE